MPRRLRDAKRPSRTYELLNLSEIERRYGLHEQRIYIMVAQGLLHPVQPHGRILYPVWELEAIFKGRYPMRFGFGPPSPRHPLAA